MNVRREPNFVRDGLRNTGAIVLATVVALLVVQPSALLHQTVREWVTFFISAPFGGFAISGMSWLVDRGLPQLVGERGVRLMGWLFVTGLLVAIFYRMLFS
ncbi:MAG: hypothetical protein NT015_06315 [Alphaproteobacteria bacterium]|nr:hypothetical protein [Alphaproteobacteria bacterium]